MKRLYRTLATVATLTAAAGVYAASENPIGRGGQDRDPFGSGSITAPAPRSADIGRSTFGQSGLGRPLPRTTGTAVNPVPEPDQWAMMLAGLALMGWIVRRKTRG